MNWIDYKYLIHISLLFFLTSCSDGDDETPPEELAAPIVKSMVIDDITNNSNASDLEVSFSKVTDESLISSYRIIVAKSTVNIDLQTTESLADDRYEEIVKNGQNVKRVLSADLLDSDGDQIQNGNQYRIYILSIADGEKATINALSNPSAPIDLANTTIKITYIGNDGVYISDGDKAVIIDALPGNLSGWHPIANGIQSNIESGTDPFGNVSAALATHAHGDHVSSTSLNSFLNRNSSAVLIAPPQVRNSGIISSDQVIDINLDMDTQTEVEINGISITVMRIRHFNPQDGTNFSSTTENYAFLVTIGGLNVLHIGDGDLSTANFEELDLKSLGVDIALIPTFNFSGQLTTAKRDVLINHVAPAHIIGLHLAEATPTTDVTSLYPDATVFNASLQFKRY